MTSRVDAHHHLWNYTASEYGWIDERMKVLRRDFGPGDLEREMRSAGIDTSVAVQARQTAEETEWLLDLAERHAFIAGVVGWAPISSPEFAAELERLACHPKLRGLRHVLQDEPDDGYMMGESFNRGMALLAERGLVYDILIYDRHLTIAAAFADRHPGQRFVLDHLAKPKIRSREMEPWRTGIRELAQRPHVSCKLSGLATEADWDHWTVDDLRPYVEVVLECFGSRRVMAGSDWPVCTAACSYHRWWQALEELLAAYSDAERRAIFGENAIDIYGLKGWDG